MNNIILVLSSYVCFISLQCIANFELFGVSLTCPSLRGAFAPKNIGTKSVNMSDIMVYLAMILLDRMVFYI